MILAISNSVVAAPKSIIFDLTSTGYPPFLIHKTKNGNPGGIAYDVFDAIMQKSGYRVKTIKLPKKRQWAYLDQNKLDALPMAKEWVKDPNKYLFSKPILKLKNVIYSNANNKVIVNHLDELTGKTLICHMGFRYLPLNPYFKQKTIKRIDASSEVAMLKMIKLNRGDATVINDYVATSIIQRNGWEKDFYKSKYIVTDYEYRILFTKKWAPLLPKFNKHLQDMKQDGTIKKIIRKYLNNN